MGIGKTDGDRQDRWGQARLMGTGKTDGEQARLMGTGKTDGDKQD